MKRLPLFLDCDGVINEDYAYVSSAKNFQFIDGIFELVLTAFF
jgi:histidinol phosphatase-like enzyme